MDALSTGAGSLNRCYYPICSIQTHRYTTAFDQSIVRRTVPSMHDAYAQESLRHAHV